MKLMNMTQLCDIDPMIDDLKGNRVQATVRNKNISKFQLLIDEVYVTESYVKGTEDGNIGQGVTPITTTASNTGSVSITVHESPTTDNPAPTNSRPTSYAKLVTGEPSRKSVNFRTLITPIENGADVAKPFESIHSISERFANTSYSFCLGKWVAYAVAANYVKNTWCKYGLIKSKLNSSNSYARAMNELRADEELKDTIVVPMLKLVGEWFNMCTIRVEYECKPPRCLSCKATRGVLVGPKLSFKSTKQIYRLVSNKNDASISGYKNKVEVSRKEVSNSNPFDALNSIKNDDELGKFLLVDDDGKLVSKVVSMVNADSDSAVK
ncbi:hypothetical protein Tco_1143340 [Tanacetum coccineum]